MELECQNLDSEFGIFSFKEEPKSSPDRPGMDTTDLPFA